MESIEEIISYNHLSDNDANILRKSFKDLHSQLTSKECEGCKRNKGTDNIYTCNCGTIENLQSQLEAKEKEIEEFKAKERLWKVRWDFQDKKESKLKQENKDLKELLKIERGNKNGSPF